MSVANPALFSPRSLRRQYTHTKTDQLKGTFFLYLIILMVIGFVCSLFYIWSRIQIVNMGYDINRELALKDRLIEENKRLTLDMAILKSPVRLEALAKNQYRMDLPLKSQIFSSEIPSPVLVAQKEVPRQTSKVNKGKPLQALSKTERKKSVPVIASSSSKIKEAKKSVPLLKKAATPTKNNIAHASKHLSPEKKSSKVTTIAGIAVQP